MPSTATPRRGMHHVAHGVSRVTSLLCADDDEELEEEQDEQDEDVQKEIDAADGGALDENAEVGYLTEERLDGGRGADDDDPDLFDADFNPISVLQQMSDQRDGGGEQPFHVLAARRRRSIHGTEVLHSDMLLEWTGRAHL